MLAQQQQARRDLTQSVIAQKQNESAEKLKQQGQTKKYLIIGGITVAALLIGVGIYFAVKNKNK
jgi:formate hydrogenlyase subunit 3/multisubunit Na+/H+ antiporter MnhD subunit